MIQIRNLLISCYYSTTIIPVSFKNSVYFEKSKVGVHFVVDMLPKVIISSHSEIALKLVCNSEGNLARRFLYSGGISDFGSDRSSSATFGQNASANFNAPILKSISADSSADERALGTLIELRRVDL